MSKIAEQIADALMNGGNGKADRLVLENSVGNLGGRCRQSVINCIDEVLSDQPASEERMCRWENRGECCWETDCGVSHFRSSVPNYCGKCGGRIEEVKDG